MVTTEDLAALARMSERIGSDILLVQGPGGNTSIKDERDLWVKASGVWLAEALRSNIFLPIERALIGGPEADYEVLEGAVAAERNPGGLRPSIETALHAIMPHRIVLHAHAVNAMTVSVLAEGEAFARERLSNLKWRWIPYRRPGAPLARAVADAMSGAVDVLLLQNHGVVVGHPTTDGAEAVLLEIEARLALPRREFPSAAAEPPPVDRFEAHPEATALAADVDATRVLCSGALIPDQIVFLGGAVPIAPSAADVPACAERCAARTGIVPALVMVPGVGGYVLRDRSRAADALIAGLLEVARRVPVGAALNTLGEADIAELLGWDAEKYRQVLNADSVK